MHTNHSTPSRPAFTLMELLVVIAIVAVLAGLTLAAVQKVRLASARASCTNNMRQLGLAANNYHGERGWLPMGSGVYNADCSWQASLLPYLEQDTLWRTTKSQFDARLPIVDESFVAAKTVIKVLACPADPYTQSPQPNKGGHLFVQGNYLGNWGVSKNLSYVENGPDRPAEGVLFEHSRVRFAEIIDGTSNTILAGERGAIFGLGGGWYFVTEFGAAFLGVEESIMSDDYSPELRPKLCPDPIVFGPGQRDNPCDFLHFWAYHGLGGNFAFCDGSVRWIAYSGRAVLPALATRAGRDTIPTE